MRCCKFIVVSGIMGGKEKECVNCEEGHIGIREFNERCEFMGK